MTNILQAKSIYFIGIGGIGMSALARYFKKQGATVSGYDKTVTTLTQQLENEGIAIHYEDNLSLLPNKPELVVYTPAIPTTHKELQYFLEHNYTVLKRSDVLQSITKNMYSICIGGTHGKTTITTMVAHILRHSGYGCNAFLGGIASNYQTNFWADANKVAVVEADEYDRSFLKLAPSIAVITAMDADHLDIYGTPEIMEDAFIQFANSVQPDGLIIHKYGLKRSNNFTHDNLLSYSFDNTLADCYANNVTVKDGGYCFNIVAKNWSIQNIILRLGGLHNIENIVAAIAVANYMGIEHTKIKAAVADFIGVKRRFEYVLKTPSHTLIDDYAHHPEELKAFIIGAKSLYPNEKITIAFQPHLYSRTKDLVTEFASSLDLADEIILLPIYPARELSIEGVSSLLILDKIHSKHKMLLSKQDFIFWVKTHMPKLLLMAGAGDIDAMVPEIKSILGSV